MAENKEKKNLTGDQKALLKLADAIHDSGFGKGFDEGVKTGQETVGELCERLLAERKEKLGASFNEDKERINIGAYLMSTACKWKGKAIAEAFCEALTDANFHKDREKIVPEINKVFGTDINPLG